MKNLNAKILWLFLITFQLFAISDQVKAQTYSVKGKVTDSTDTIPLPGATILLVNISDTTIFVGTTTSSNGYFQFARVAPAHYRLKISFISYNTYKQSIYVKNSNVILPTIKLNKINTQLKEVTIVTNQIRVEQKGDTLQFNANAYKTNPDATAEDLIKKMPGVTSDGSTIKVNGEEVKKVLVDGKSFFGDDPSVTLKNFPAEMVGEVQVFDKSSDQMQFTGFKDGDEQKTLNIVTKGEKSEGKFGKIYAGYGTDKRYNAGLTFNSFNDSRRISVIGMSNNINQQNFNISDIMSVMSNSGAQSGGPPGPNSPMANFYSGQQSGNTRTNAFGTNYVDTWGKKINISCSYFFNQTTNTISSSSIRNYFTEDKLIYKQNNFSETENLNHRGNLKFEYMIDSANTIKLSPNVTFQVNQSKITSNNKLFGNDAFLSQTANESNTKYSGYNFQNEALYQHKFNKKGRTFSLNFYTQLNNREGNGDYYSSSLYDDTATVSTIINQNYQSDSKGITYGGNISYTEPIGKNGQFIVTYRPSETKNNAEKNTYNLNNSGENLSPDSTLSNSFNSVYTSQRGGISYRLSSQKLNVSLGSDVQQSEFVVNQTFPNNSTTDKIFTNILPTTMFNYKFSKTRNLNIMYRTQTKSPTNTQLQNVMDVSNPLLVKAGNIALIPAYENNLMMRMGFTNADKTRNFFVFFMGNQTNNYIGNSTNLINSDTTILGYNIKKASQLTIPVNLNNYYSMRCFSVYSFPLSKIKSNLNLNMGYTYSHTPAVINDKINYSGNQSINGGVNVSSNISRYFDFSLAYNGNYNTVENTLQTQSNNSYYNHTATAKVNFILFKKLILNSDLNQITYSGLSQSYNQNYFLWNAYIGFKFLKDQSLEAKISVYDLLNQNQSISRTITEMYTEDSNTEILKRYLMVTLTYTF